MGQAPHVFAISRSAAPMPAKNIQESELLSVQRAEEIFSIAVAAARGMGVGDLEAMVGAGTHALTRFANNTIHQNVAERSGYLSIRVLLDGRTARASTNQLDAEGVRRVVDEAVAITRLQEPDPELLALSEPAEYVPVQRYFSTTADITPI